MSTSFLPFYPAVVALDGMYTIQFSSNTHIMFLLSFHSSYHSWYIYQQIPTFFFVKVHIETLQVYLTLLILKLWAEFPTFAASSTLGLFLHMSPTIDPLMCHVRFKFHFFTHTNLFICSLFFKNRQNDNISTFRRCQYY